MAKIPCITTKTSRAYLIKDYGDTSKYAVLTVNRLTKQVVLKTDKRLVGEKENFFTLYGGATGSKFTEEEKIKI